MVDLKKLDTELRKIEDKKLSQIEKALSDPDLRKWILSQYEHGVKISLICDTLNSVIAAKFKPEEIFIPRKGVKEKRKPIFRPSHIKKIINQQKED
jgi:hypothetical protein